MTIQEGRGPRKAGSKRSLDVFSGYVYQRLVEALDVGAGIVEAEQVVANEFMKGLQQKRCASERCAVYCFTLLVTYRFFYDLDHKLGILWPEVKVRVIKIFIETVDRLFQLLARYFLSAPYALTVR